MSILKKVFFVLVFLLVYFFVTIEIGKSIDKEIGFDKKVISSYRNPKN